MTPVARGAKADYWDVWSSMFRDHFYQRVESWCTARDMEFMVRLNHEELMMSAGGDVIKNEGSFWRDMCYVGVPGVDNLNQIRPGIVADFPKLAGSATHLFGRPLGWVFFNESNQTETRTVTLAGQGQVQECGTRLAARYILWPGSPMRPARWPCPSRSHPMNRGSSSSARSRQASARRCRPSPAVRPLPNWTATGRWLWAKNR